MALSVQLHSDNADGTFQIITIVKTGADQATFYKSTSTDTSAVEPYQVFGIAANIAALRISCHTRVLFVTADIDVSVIARAAGQPATVDVTVTPALFGEGSYSAPLRTGDVQALTTFLTSAQFPAAS